jgi:hypothetical protein
VGRDQKRGLLRRINALGLTVKGRNGEVRQATIKGYRREHPQVWVDDDFAPITIPLNWHTVRGIADGHLPPQIDVHW